MRARNGVATALTQYVMDPFFATGSIVGLVTIFAATGAVAGGVAGLFGIGGGVIMVPVLSTAFMMFGVPHDQSVHVAVATSLAAIIPTSLISYRNHSRHGAVDYEVLQRWAPFLVLGGISGGITATLVPAHVLGVMFALSCGFFSFQFWFNRRAVGEGKSPVSRKTQCFFAFLIGQASSMIGIGGGVFGVMLMSAMRRSIHRSVATASAVGFLVAVPGTIIHMIGAAPGFTVPFGTIGMIHPVALLLMVPTAMAVTPLGVRLAHKLHARILQRIFALLLLSMALKMLYSAIT